MPACAHSVHFIVIIVVTYSLIVFVAIENNQEIEIGQKCRSGIADPCVCIRLMVNWISRCGRNVTCRPSRQVGSKVEIQLNNEVQVREIQSLKTNIQTIIFIYTICNVKLL